MLMHKGKCLIAILVTIPYEILWKTLKESNNNVHRKRQQNNKMACPVYLGIWGGGGAAGRRVTKEEFRYGCAARHFKTHHIYTPVL